MNRLLSLPPPDSFPNRLRRARIIKGFSGSELAAKVGTSRPSVPRWESGKTAPSMASLLALAQALGVSHLWLGYGEGPMEAPEISSREKIHCPEPGAMESPICPSKSKAPLAGEALVSSTTAR